MDQETLADRVGVTRPQVTKYENNTNGPPDYIVERVAQLFNVTPAYVRYGDVDARMVAVRGYVGAGAMVEAIEHEPTRSVEVPASWTDAFALQVKGLSCYPIYDDGDFIVIRGERRMHEEEFIGRMTLVETSDGMGLVKKVRRGSAAGLYTLESPNAPPIEDVTLLSARPVRLHLPR